MTAKDELLTIVEISVALIGFSGLIFVFRSRDITELEVRDLSALAMILGAGGLTLVFALLPLPFSYLGLAEPQLWRLCSGLFAAGMLGAGTAFLLVNRRLVAKGHAERTPRLNRLTLFSAFLTAVLLGLVAAGTFPAGPAVYLLGLVVCILHCLVYVAFMLVVARRFDTPRRVDRHS